MPQKRNYKREYLLFHSSEKEIRNRAIRNKARRKAEKEGRVKMGDGKDLHHINGIRSLKVRVMSASANRGKREKSRLKGFKQKRI